MLQLLQRLLSDVIHGVPNHLVPRADSYFPGAKIQGFGEHNQLSRIWSLCRRLVSFCSQNRAHGCSLRYGCTFKLLYIIKNLHKNIIIIVYSSLQVSKKHDINPKDFTD